MSDRRHRDDRDDGRGEKRRRGDDDSRPSDPPGGLPGPPDAPQHEGGGQDLSLSVEDTNAMRAALGLKPLKMGSSSTTVDRETAEKKRHTDERLRKERERDAEEHRTRIDAQREKRKLEEKLRKTRKLGEAQDEEDEDMAAWVIKSRLAEQALAREKAEREAKEAAAKVKAEARAADSDDEYTAEDLAGMKVKHGYGDLADGETVILTLADRAILDEKGELMEDAEGEELENVLKAEDKKRDKARKAATKKGKPLFGEDGKKMSLLDKYDAEEADEALQLDKEGGMASEQQRRMDEVRRRLAEGSAALESAATTSAAPSITSGSDFYTQSEVAAFAKPRRKKKDRQLRKKADEEGEEEGGTAALMAQLEAEAEQAAAADAAGGRRPDLGSRSEGQGRRDRKEQEQIAAQKEKRARFDAALEKANWASLALRPQTAAAAARGADAHVGADGADDELFESLSRARRQAQQAATTQAAGAPGASLLEAMALKAAERREADEAILVAQLAAGTEVYTEATEFVKNIGVEADADDEAGPSAAPGATAAAAAATRGPGTQSTALPSSTAAAGATPMKVEDEEGGYMGMDVDDSERDQRDGDGGAAGAEDSKAPAKWGAWVTAEDAEHAAQSGQQADKAKQRAKAAKAEPALESITSERTVGKGLSSVLAMMHEKGDLSDANKVIWAGRTNDKKPVMLIGLEDVYQGGGHEERLARSIEAALTQRDVLGRVMTPKQRFREQCYRFHGIYPSKNQQEKQQRKEAEDVRSRQAATSENPSAELDRLQAIQKQTGKAHVILTGSDAVKPNSVKAPSGLGGGITPMTGDRKVEAMLGIKKQAKDMPPPPPRKPKD